MINGRNIWLEPLDAWFFGLLQMHVIGMYLNPLITIQRISANNSIDELCKIMGYISSKDP